MFSRSYIDIPRHSNQGFFDFPLHCYNELQIQDGCWEYHRPGIDVPFLHVLNQ